MKSFWLSLLLFILLLCSCKTKEVAREIDSNERFTSDISALNEQVKQDTTKVKKVEQTEEFTRIIEREIITEYDTEKGVPNKITEKKKVTEQGVKTKTDESQDRGITSVQKDSIDHFLDSTKKEDIKEETKEESVAKGMFDSFGKWLGIGLVVLIIVALVWRKVKKKLHL